MAQTVLLVDDDQATLLGMIELLSGAGYEVWGASNFGDARRTLDRATPDLLITDVRLGSFNGLQLVIHGRGDDPGMPAIVTTGFADPVIAADAQALGALYLVKPIAPAELLEAVARQLAGAGRG